MSAEARGFEDWMGEMRRALAALQRFPSAGRPEPNFGAGGARSILVDPYRLIYIHLPGSDEITIVDLRHVRRAREGGHLDLLK